MKRLRSISWGKVVLRTALAYVFGAIVLTMLGEQFGWAWTMGDNGLPTLFVPFAPFFIMFFLVGFVFSPILFASWIVPVGVAAVTLIGLGFRVRTMRLKGKPAVWSLMLTALIMMALFAGEYRPLVQPHEGVEMVWLTEPSNPVMSSLKVRQAMFEMKPCRYTLIRWEGSTLIYDELCGLTIRTKFDKSIGTLFSYDVETDEKARLSHATVLTEDSYVQSVGERTNILPSSQRRAWFEIQDEFYDNISWRWDTLPSDDGVWHAVVIEGLYSSAEDVVVVRP